MTLYQTVNRSVRLLTLRPAAIAVVLCAIIWVPLREAYASSAISARAASADVSVVSCKTYVKNQILRVTFRVSGRDLRTDHGYLHAGRIAFQFGQLTSKGEFAQTARADLRTMANDNEFALDGTRVLRFASESSDDGLDTHIAFGNSDQAVRLDLQASALVDFLALNGVKDPKTIELNCGRATTLPAYCQRTYGSATACTN